MKKLVFLLMTLLSIFSLSGFAEPIKTIRFATEATYPPFEFIDESGQIKGFDIDIAKALCKKMNATCTFTTQTFNSLIPSLNLGKFDAIIAVISITPEREKQVAFTHSYYEPSASFVADRKKNYTLADMEGKIIGAQQGSTFETYARDKYGNKVTIKTYASVQDAFLDLVANRVDTVLADTPIVKTFLQQNSNSKQFTIVDHPIVDPVYFGTGYGIAIRKSDAALLNALNKALAEIKADGTYETIVKKYFKH